MFGYEQFTLDRIVAADMYRNYKLSPAYGFVIVLFLSGCGLFDHQKTYTLNTTVLPEEAGSIHPSSGTFDKGEQVKLRAEPNDGWAFANWSGDIQGTQNPLQVLINRETHLTATFVPVRGRVTDIDGNEYKTIVIGKQIWMAENLRVTRYRDGSPLAADPANLLWQNNRSGAFSVYPHQSIDGLESREDVLQAYGKLYNAYAAMDPRGLCPDNWRVPSDSDWKDLEFYLGIPSSELDGTGLRGSDEGNQIKSRRQVDSPLGAPWATDQHPRWNNHDIQHGTNMHGFSALPAGNRNPNGHYYSIGTNGYWWSSSGHTSNNAWRRRVNFLSPYLYRFDYDKRYGYSVRCVRSHAPENDG